MPSLPKFDLLSFGHIDASSEAIEEPDLLLSGYFDYRNAAYNIEQGNTWLLLGPKGSGKSAVLEHLKLKWEDRYDRFFDYWNLAAFPVRDVTSIPMGQSPGASRNQAAWEFLLLLRIIQSLNMDQGLNCTGEFTTLISGLKKQGYLVNDWTAGVMRWVDGGLKFDAKIIGAQTTFKRQDISPLEASAYIKQVISACSTQSRHLIALDGLDSFFFEANDEWGSLAGLSQAVYNLNNELRTTETNVSVVMAARSDIYDVLPGAENNKMKPHAVYLDWNMGGIGAKNQLWHLVSMKAHARHPEVTTIPSQYLRTPIQIGPHTKMAEYLLDNTRLLPRDLIALMTRLATVYHGASQVTEAAATRAVKLYTEDYFVGEIMDNLGGILPADNARGLQRFQDALRTVPSRFFTFDYLCEELEGDLTKAEIKHLLRQMFEVGGIGIRNGRYTDFIYRKASGAGFSTRYKFMLHDALTRAWNRPWADHDWA